MFVLSDDGGRTWQQRPIHLAGSVWECNLQEDLLNPDTYAVSLTLIIDGKAGAADETLVTHDAGRTWQRASLPASMEYSCATLSRQLALPSQMQARPCTVDPWDPNHLYAFIYNFPTTPQRQSLYESRDGGSSWHRLHVWNTALGYMEIHPTSNGLYVVDSQDPVGDEGVFRSTDGGVSWTRLPKKGKYLRRDLLRFGMMPISEALRGRSLLQCHERFEGCPTLTSEQSREGLRTSVDRIQGYAPLEQIQVLLPGQQDDFAKPGRRRDRLRRGLDTH